MANAVEILQTTNSRLSTSFMHEHVQLIGLRQTDAHTVYFHFRRRFVFPRRIFLRLFSILVFRSFLCDGISIRCTLSHRTNVYSVFHWFVCVDRYCVLVLCIHIYAKLIDTNRNESRSLLRWRKKGEKFTHTQTVTSVNVLGHSIYIYLLANEKLENRFFVTSTEATQVRCVQCWSNI